MTDLFDPIEAAASAARRRRSQERAASASRSVQHEVPMAPPPEAKTYRLTVRGSDGSSVPVLHDPQTRITYPLPAV